MPINYTDAYLRGYVDPDTEQRAAGDVDALGSFPEFWRDKLIALRVYVLICMDKQAEPEDLFTAKLATYNKEYSATLAQARAAVAATNDASPSLFSIPILRG